MTQLSIIIVSFNARADLERCLESLHASPPATAHEIVVVDNASTDGSADAEAVGLFDERFFMYTEDVDFCAAIRARGRRILFTPDVEVVHLRGRSAASQPEATRAAYRRSQIAFYEKHHPVWAPLLR